jgi:hypothetical protein
LKAFEEVLMKSRLKLVVVALGVSAVIVGGAAAASSPAVQTGGATNIKQGSVVLHGIVSPNGSPTAYQFQWGLTTAYGTTSRSLSAGRGMKPVSVHATPTHLVPGTVYHYQLIAISKSGKTLGRDRHFKTAGNPPAAVATGVATQPATTGVTLTGVVNPNHQRTTWRFDYGPTIVYQSHTTGGVIPATSGPTTVSERVEGLAPGTIFHYRLVAVNRGVAVPGADSTFMTFPSPAPVPAVHAKTTPHRARHRPFVFTTSGRVSGPSTIPSAFACAGQVRIRFWLHKRRVQSTLVPVAPDCSFSSQAIFQHRPGANKHRKVSLRVIVRFMGDGYLAPSTAPTEHVKLG